MITAELDVKGKLFGIRFIPGGSNGLAEIYIEDDGNWLFQCRVDKYWLKDLRDVAQLGHTMWLMERHAKDQTKAEASPEGRSISTAD